MFFYVSRVSGEISKNAQRKKTRCSRDQWKELGAQKEMWAALGGLPGWNFHSFKNRWVPPAKHPPSCLRPIDCSCGQCGQCVSVHKVNPLRSNADPRAASLSDLEPSSSACKTKRHRGSFTFTHPSGRSEARRCLACAHPI